MLPRVVCDLVRSRLEEGAAAAVLDMARFGFAVGRDADVLKDVE